MDEIDKKIIEILKNNSRISNTEIAKKLNLTEGAIRFRMNKLIKKGIIKKFTIEVKDSSQKALVFIYTTKEFNFKDFLDFLNKEHIKERILNLFEVSGEFDLVLVLKFESMKELNEDIDKIRNFKGVEKTITNVVLNEI